ncbi:MAG: hypothetical protein ACXU8O_07565 [Asticcacaulis sp.]
MPVKAALTFAYDHLGQYLHDGPCDPALLMHALTRRQPISGRKGEIRLGSVGDMAHMAVISAQKTILKADIRPSKPLPPSVEFKPMAWRSNPAWRAAIMREPPSEPYMVIIFDKATDYADSLRLSSQDVLFECGPQPRMYNLAQVRRGLSVLDAAEPALIFEAKRLIDMRLRNPARVRPADERLAILCERIPDLMNLCDEFADPGTAEFEALRLIANVEAKAGIHARAA